MLLLLHPPHHDGRYLNHKPKINPSSLVSLVWSFVQMQEKSPVQRTQGALRLLVALASELVSCCLLQKPPASETMTSEPAELRVRVADILREAGSSVGGTTNTAIPGF